SWIFTKEGMVASRRRALTPEYASPPRHLLRPRRLAVLSNAGTNATLNPTPNYQGPDCETLVVSLGRSLPSAAAAPFFKQLIFCKLSENSKATTAKCGVLC